MEPKKLFGMAGAIITTITAIVLFIIEKDRLVAFFFPEKKDVSTALFLATVFATNIVQFYFMYRLYYKLLMSYHDVKSKFENEKTERFRIQSLLFDADELTYQDRVTRIPNELKFEKDLESRASAVYYMILFDLDGFSEINKKYGFDKGDEVISEIARNIYLKMRRDERIYKIPEKDFDGFRRRIYRKYSGGDEFIILIKGPQFEAVGFAQRLHNQLQNLSNKSELLNGFYEAKFHATIVPLSPRDSYQDAKRNLGKMFVHAAEELNRMSVYWDKEQERVERGKFKDAGFIYDKAIAAFTVT